MNQEPPKPVHGLLQQVIIVDALSNTLIPIGAAFMYAVRRDHGSGVCYATKINIEHSNGVTIRKRVILSVVFGESLVRSKKLHRALVLRKFLQCPTAREAGPRGC